MHGWSFDRCRRAAGTLGIVSVAFVVFWGIVLTTLMLRDDPAAFHCGDAFCSPGEIALLLSRNGLVVLWVVAPYLLVGWILWCLATQLNHSMPRALRWHPRWSSNMILILGVPFGIGHIWMTYATYLMFKHNPQGTFCTEADAQNQMNFYPSCAVTLSEIATLFARNMFILTLVLAPLIVVSWLLIVFLVSLRRGRLRRWLRRHAFK